MGSEIWIAGFPSSVGGADTELDHQIDLLRARDVAVHLVPMFGAAPEMRRSAEGRGCRVHEYEDGIFKDRVVVSYCNGNFLEKLPRIMERGRPRRVIWFNCMTWTFPGEVAAHERGWIDLFGFVSDYQRGLLSPQLERLGPVRSFPYRPYFNVSRIPFRYRAWNGTYNVGRISRDDAGKFAPDTWRIFDRILVPRGLAKKVFILGHGPNAAGKIGPPPAGLDWMTWTPGAIETSAFFGTLDTMVHKTGGSRESYCRVLIESYAHGVVPVVERDYAFPELVVHGETGFMAADSDEMSYHASFLAHHPERHRAMAEAGRAYLERVLADPERCWTGWQAALAE